MQTIGLDGTTSCISVPTSTNPAAGGIISVNASAFHSEQTGDGGCVSVSVSGDAYFRNTSTKTLCDMYASVSIPHAVNVTGFSCSVLNNTNEAFLISLRRRNLDGTLTFPAGNSIMATVTSALSTATVQNKVNAASISNSLIDNSVNSYFIYANFGNTTIVDQNQQVVSCSITHS